MRRDCNFQGENLQANKRVNIPWNNFSFIFIVYSLCITFIIGYGNRLQSHDCPGKRSSMPTSDVALVCLPQTSLRQQCDPHHAFVNSFSVYGGQSKVHLCKRHGELEKETMGIYRRALHYGTS